MGSSSERSCSSPSAAASSHCHISVAQLDNTLGSLRDLFDGFAGDRNSSISTLMRTSVRGQTNLWCSAILSVHASQSLVSWSYVTTCAPLTPADAASSRSEENTSELQSLMRTSYAVFCLKKKNNNN